MVKKDKIRYSLIIPPLTDPTSPYHSISYLIGAASSAGYNNFLCLDSNIECLNCVAQKEHVEALLCACHEIRTELEKKDHLTRGEQMLYRFAIKAVGLKPDSAQKAISIMRDPETFYSYSTYHHAALVLKRWMDVLSVRGFPGQFGSLGFDLNMNIANFSNIKDLTNIYLLNKLVNPFSPYFCGPFLKILDSNFHLIGLSVNYTSQLPFALSIAKIIRSKLPECVIIAGGTEITDIVKRTVNRRLIWDLFSEFDAIVVGEGETALIAILDSIHSQKSLPKECPGVLVRDDPIILDDFKLLLHMTYENLSTLADAKYDIWNYNQYWSPEPVVLYSPTRGCYWNKCTFCDYGLNTDSPTSPSRHRSITTLIRELKNIREISRTLYLAVDAISPAYLRRFAKATLDNEISVRWCAELRLERLFQEGLAEELRKSGCVCISFGYESGSQRILDLIDKGVKVSEIKGVLKELSRADIGVQMMGFIGFPSETPEEAFMTHSFLQNMRNYWALAEIGDFVLTSGAIVAKRYKDFGIESVSPYDGDDIVRELYWIQDGNKRVSGDMRSKPIEDISTNLARFSDDRPFVGGIDSSHSILYFAKYGPKLVPPYMEDIKPSRSIVEIAVYKTPLRNVDKFVDRSDLGKYYAKKMYQGGVRLSHIMKWFNEYPDEQNAKDGYIRDLEVYPSGDYLTLTEQEAKYLKNPAYRAAKELLLKSKGVL